MQIDAAARRQRLERAPEQLGVGLQVPVVDDVRHEDRVIALRPGLPEHVDGDRVDAAGEAGFCDILLGQLADRGQLHDRAAQARMALGQGDGKASGAAAHVQQPRHPLEVAVSGDPDSRRHRVAVHERSDRTGHVGAELTGLPGLDGASLVVHRLGLQRRDIALGVHVAAVEAEGVAPVERAVVQQIEPRRLRRLVAAQVHLEEAQRRQHGQHALQGMKVQP